MGLARRRERDRRHPACHTRDPPAGRRAGADVRHRRLPRVVRARRGRRRRRDRGLRASGRRAGIRGNRADGCRLHLPPPTGPRRAAPRRPSASTSADPSRHRGATARRPRVPGPDRPSPDRGRARPSRPFRYLLRAAESEAAIGAYRDALGLLERIRATAVGENRARLLSLRGDLLVAVGDASAVAAYREALDAAADRRPAASRAPVACRSDVRATPDRDRRARRRGRVRRARRHGSAARARPGWPTSPATTTRHGRSGRSRGFGCSPARRTGGRSIWSSLQGLIAHLDGEWFDRIRFELRTASLTPDIANCALRRLPLPGRVPALRIDALRRRSSNSHGRSSRPARRAERCARSRSRAPSSGSRRCCPATSRSRASSSPKRPTCITHSARRAERRTASNGSRRSGSPRATWTRPADCSSKRSRWRAGRPSRCT